MHNLQEQENQLDAYQASIQFITYGDSILSGLHRRVSACDHLSRAMEGTPLHIAKANQAWSAKERVIYLGHANGSVLECAACLDLLQVKGLLSEIQIKPGKETLHLTCNLIIAMRKTSFTELRENSPHPYRSNPEIYFSHERLDVYQVSLLFAEWVENLNWESTGRSGMRRRLDSSSTAIALNIAEGNGRFTKTDHAHFLTIAQGAVSRSTAGLDIAIARNMFTKSDIEPGKNLLDRISRMLTGMRKKLQHTSPAQRRVSTRSLD